MFFFPYSTDAPVYYWPFASVGLIVANIIVFIAMISGSISGPENWILWYGEGLHPEQWLTSIFMHASFDHLVGNMLFLWVFGLVVEGKLGWQKLLACYLSIGVGQSMIEQIMMLPFSGEGGGSLGASAAIFGLMAMAAVWAPKNDITFGYVIFFRWGTFDVSILALAVFYAGMEILFLMLSGGREGSSWLHLMGMALGAPLAIVMLRRGVVDCEGWDLLHVWKGDYGGFREQPDPQVTFAKTAERQKQTDQNLLANAKSQLRQFLQQGNLPAALTLYRKMGEVGDGLTLENDELRAIIKSLHQQRRWAESAPFMAELIERFPAGADLVRVKLAQICVVELERPGKALDLLADVDQSGLTREQATLVKRIEGKSLAMQAEGVIELDTEQW
jgi:membrane associated rhomboid family serine protease